MTYNQWRNAIRFRERGDKLDRDPKGYFAAVELLERIEKALPQRKPTNA